MQVIRDAFQIDALRHEKLGEYGSVSRVSFQAALLKKFAEFRHPILEPAACNLFRLLKVHVKLVPYRKFASESS